MPGQFVEHEHAGIEDIQKTPNIHPIHKSHHRYSEAGEDKESFAPERRRYSSEDAWRYKTSEELGSSSLSHWGLLASYSPHGYTQVMMIMIALIMVVMMMIMISVIMVVMMMIMIAVIIVVMIMMLQVLEANKTASQLMMAELKRNLWTG